MAKAMGVGSALIMLGCLGGTTSRPPATPAEQLQQAKASAERAEWPAARESAVAFWVKNCKRTRSTEAGCASAQLVRGEAELAMDAPETAFLSFDWALKNGDAAAQQEAQQGLVRAKDLLSKLLDQHASSQAWLVVEQDFDDNHKFGPERAAYTLDGKPLGDVNGNRRFYAREHRVLAQAIAPGQRRLGIEIHWKGQGTFDNYLWKSYRPFEFEAPERGVVVVSLDVTYSDGGPSDKSVEQTFRVTTLPLTD